MKLFYWGESPPVVDADDKQHKNAVELGVVPETCLLGGPALAAAIQAKEDPCSACVCPDRSRCGGRAMSSDQTPDFDASLGRLDRGALDVIRAGQIRKVLREIDE